MQIHKNTTILWNPENHALYFKRLHTGKRAIRDNCTELSMPNALTDAIHQMAEASKQTGGITFTNLNGNKTDDDEDEVPIHVANNNQ